MVKLPNHIKCIIIGLLLSDGYLAKGKRSINVWFGLSQSSIHSKYFFSVYLALSHYCSSYPKSRIESRNNKYFNRLDLVTRSMPCLTELYEIFYVNGIKIVPANIFDLLTPVAFSQ